MFAFCQETPLTKPLSQEGDEELVEPAAGLLSAERVEAEDVTR